MQGYFVRRCLAVVSLAALVATLGAAGEIQSTMRNVSSGVYEAQGYQLSPAYDVQVASTARDLATPQAFELFRPDDRAVTIGRMFTSCSCIQLETTKRTFEPGERILFQLHNVRATPTNGQVYAIFVQLTKPVRTTLRIDTFVQTGVGIGTPPAATNQAAAPGAASADHASHTAAATAAPAAAVGEPPQVPGLNNELAALLSSVDTENRGEGTGDLAFDIMEAEVASRNVPTLDEEDEDGEQADASGDGAMVQLPGSLELPEGDDVRESLGEARDNLESIYHAEGENLAQELQTDVDAARQAMDSYFQTEPVDTAADAGGIGGDLPDFYAQQPAAAPSEAPVAAATQQGIVATQSAPAVQPQIVMPGQPALANATELPPEAQAQLAQLQAQLEAQTGQPVIVAPVQVAPVQVMSPSPVQQLQPPVQMQVQPPVQTQAPAQAMQPPAQTPRQDASPLGRVQAVTLITVGVRDMPAAMRFYEALGWQRAARGKYDQTAFFQLNGQVLALYPMNDLLQEQNMDNAAPTPGGITLALHVQDKADVWNIYQRFIDAGGKSLRAPAEMASGAVSSYVADPDGNPWEISWVPQFRIDENGGLWLP